MDRNYNIEHHVYHGHHILMLVIKRGFSTERFIIPASWAVIALIVVIALASLLIWTIRARRRRAGIA